MITVNTREEYLYEVSKHLLQPASCVELGVYEGDFSQMIFDILNPCLLILIDPFEQGGDKYPDGSNTAYSNDGHHQRVVNRFDGMPVVVGKQYSYNVVRWLADKSIGFVYHDASHLYHDIKRDLNDWLPKLKENGLMCGHDYVDIEGFGVKQAVNEFMEEHNFEMIIYNQNGGDFALKRKNIFNEKPILHGELEQTKNRIFLP